MGYQNAMIAFQRQLNLRNRDVVIYNPQKKVVENQASKSIPNNNIDIRGVNNNKVKEKDKSPLHDPLTRNVENKRDVIVADKL